MVIDFHNHIGRKKGLTFTDEDLLARMDASGVDRAVVFSFPENINNGFIQEACRRHPDRLTGFATVNPWDENAEAELEACLDGGRMKGIKLHSLKHGFNFDNHLLLDPIFEIARKYKVPVIAYGAANVLCVSNMFEEMARTFPDVPLVMAQIQQGLQARELVGKGARLRFVARREALLGRRQHLGVALDDGQAVLVDAGAAEHHVARVRHLVLDRQRDAQRVAEA